MLFWPQQCNANLTEGSNHPSQTEAHFNTTIFAVKFSKVYIMYKYWQTNKQKPASIAASRKFYNVLYIPSSSIWTSGLGGHLVFPSSCHDSSSTVGEGTLCWLGWQLILSFSPTVAIAWSGTDGSAGNCARRAWTSRVVLDIALPTPFSAKHWYSPASSAPGRFKENVPEWGSSGVKLIPTPSRFHWYLKLQQSSTQNFDQVTKFRGNRLTELGDLVAKNK